MNAAIVPILYHFLALVLEVCSLLAFAVEGSSVSPLQLRSQAAFFLSRVNVRVTDDNLFSSQGIFALLGVGSEHNSWRQAH